MINNECLSGFELYSRWVPLIRHHLRYEIRLPGTIQCHSGYDIGLLSSKQQHTSYDAWLPGTIHQH